MTDLPWDYQLIDGKCEMVEKFNKNDSNAMQFLSKTRSYPLSYNREDIKNEFIKEFLTPKPLLSNEFIKKSQKFIQRDIVLDNLFEVQMSPLAVDFTFKKDDDGLKFDEYEEV